MHEPKMSPVEIFAWFFIAGTGDIAGMLLTSLAIPVLPTIISVLFLMSFWLYCALKRIPSGWGLGLNLLDSVPGIGAGPMMTAAVGKTVADDRNLKFAKKISKPGKVLKLKKRPLEKVKETAKRAA